MISNVDYQLNNSSRELTLNWPDGFKSQFHYVWLRHHARCADGMPNDTEIKIDLIPDDISSLAVKSCSASDEYLTINWHDDDIITNHLLCDLRRSAYDDQSRSLQKHRPILWDAQSTQMPPHFEFSELQSESSQLEILTAVRDFGIAFVSDVPTEPDSIKIIAKLFGPIHVNNYGEVFNVMSDASMNLGSNTGVYLSPHTDESYRHEAPGISMFHCLHPASYGGESILVDGFKVAEALKYQHPDSFQTLSKTPILFRRYAPPDEDMRSHTRIIATDIDGQVTGIRWTDRTLPPQDIPKESVEPVYQALVHLNNLIKSGLFNYQYKMKSGDLHVFDNHRILHGRTEFDIQSGSRHLQQCSVNRDEFHNCLRLLGAKLGRPDFELVLSSGAAG